MTTKSWAALYRTNEHSSAFCAIRSQSRAMLLRRGGLSGEGMPLLDRNPNGEVADSLKGVRSLYRVDVNGYGKINAADPVYQEMKVWQADNGNGIVDTDEAKALSDLGVTELDYMQSRFTQYGQMKLMAPKDIEARFACIVQVANEWRMVCVA